TVSCSDGTARYRFWNEDAPNPPRYQGPTVNPGDLVYSYTEWQGNNTCYYFEENESTGAYKPYTHPDCNHPGLHSADFVIEKALNHYLPTFGHFRQDYNYTQYGSGNWYLTTTNSDNVILVDSTGETVCSDNGVISSTDHGFYHYHDSDC
ncbi:MAG: hypothetical protein ACRDRL_01230, partial [Sciscionella sp.]